MEDKVTKDAVIEIIKQKNVQQNFVIIKDIVTYLS